jgi:hypothetical protein
VFGSITGGTASAVTVGGDLNIYTGGIVNVSASSANTFIGTVTVNANP